jgi:subtilisin family serine protease
LDRQFAVALAALTIFWSGCGPEASIVDAGTGTERGARKLSGSRVRAPAPPGSGEARRLCTPGPPGMSCPRVEDAGVVPGRLVVKFRGEFREPPDVVHAGGLRFADVAPSGGADLDRIIARFGVRSIEPVFGSLFAGTDRRPGSDAGKRRRRSFRLALDRARSTFPRRALRARFGAEPPDLTRVFALALPPDADLHDAARAFAANPAVEYAAPDRVAVIETLPDDPYLATSGSWGQSYADLWALGMIRAPEAWAYSTGAGTLVAVVDSGLDWVHPDVAENVWTNAAEAGGLPGVDDDQNGFVDDVRGWDFACQDADPADGHGHGTHVSGTIAATGGNGVGVIGVAYGARIMPVKALADDGYGQITDLANAVAYAALNGADVINNSWGCYGEGCADAALADALALARSLGSVVVVAAGNEGADVSHAFPAGAPDVLTVAATGVDDSLPSFTNHGWLIDLAAPGGGPAAGWRAESLYNVLSLRAAGTGDPMFLVGTDYIRLAGTSMAAPHVAGAAALVLSANPSLTVAQVESVLRHSAADGVGDPSLDVNGYDPHYGWGRLDVAAAVALAAAPPDDPSVLKVVADPIFFDLPASPCEGVRSLPIGVYDVGGGGLQWTASAPPWTVVNPATGEAPGTAWVTVTSLENRSGTLTIDAGSAVDGGVELPVAQQLVDGLRVRNCDAAASLGGSWDPVWSGGISAGPGVPDGAGGAIYVWADDGTHDLYAQRVDADGGPAWTPGGIRLTSASGVEHQPAIVSDGAGGALIAYSEGPWTAELWAVSDIRAQRVSASGQKLWGDEGVSVTEAEGAQLAPSIASDGSGGAVIAWEDDRTGIGNIYAQRIASSGSPMWQGGGVPVRLQGSWQYRPSIASDGEGGAFIAWVDAREPFWAIYAQRLNSSGVARWLETGIRVAPQPTRGAKIVPDGENGAYVAWMDFRARESAGVFDRCDIYAARLDREGRPLWSEGGVPVTEGASVAPSKFEPGWESSEVTLSPDGHGGLFFVWMDARNGNDWDVYAQRLDLNGQRRWGHAGVPVVEAASDQLAPMVVGDGLDGALFAWADQRPGQSDIFVQRLNGEGARLLPAGGIWLEGKPGKQAYPFIVPLGTGRRVMVSWDDETADMAGVVVDLASVDVGTIEPPVHPRAGCGCGTGAGASGFELSLVALALWRWRSAVAAATRSGGSRRAP